jgi:hypothetical protein
MLKLRHVLAAGAAAFLSTAAGSANADCCGTYTSRFVAPEYTITSDPVLVMEPQQACCGALPGVVEFRPTFRAWRQGVITYERVPAHGAY